VAAAAEESLEEELELVSEIAMDDPNQVVLHKEMFLEQNSDTRDLRLREEFVDFGFTEYGRVSEQRAITLDNKFPFEGIAEVQKPKLSSHGFHLRSLPGLT
jgi:hypothetical protein